MGKYISESKTKHGTPKREVWKDDFGLFAGRVLRLQAVRFSGEGSRVAGDDRQTHPSCSEKAWNELIVQCWKSTNC